MTAPRVIGGIDLAQVNNLSRGDIVKEWKAYAAKLGLECDDNGVPVVHHGPKRRRRPAIRVTPETVADRISAALEAAGVGRSLPLSNRAQRADRGSSIDPLAPRMPDPVQGATENQLADLESLGLPTSCMTCPRRNTRESSSAYGYCEGCPSIERLCPGCGEHKAQKDWAAGWRQLSPGVHAPTWVCADCRADRRTFALVPRFALTLELSDIQRHLLVGALVRLPGAPSGAEIVPIARLVAALREGGSIDIDISDCNVHQRESTGTILANVRNDARAEVRDIAQKLYAAWVNQTFQGETPKAAARVLTAAEKSALLNGERPV